MCCIAGCSCRCDYPEGRQTIRSTALKRRYLSLAPGVEREWRHNSSSPRNKCSAAFEEITTMVRTVQERPIKFISLPPPSSPPFTLLMSAWRPLRRRRGRRRWLDEVIFWWNGGIRAQHMTRARSGRVAESNGRRPTAPARPAIHRVKVGSFRGFTRTIWEQSLISAKVVHASVLLSHPSPTCGRRAAPRV